MNDEGLNLEIWTLPNSGDFKRKADITVWVIDRNLDARFLDLSSGAIAVANVCPHLDKILTVDPADHTNDQGSTLMVYRNGVWLAAFVVVEREDRASETQPWTTFGVEGLEWFLERARVRAFDYPDDPIREGDWLYGAPSILKTPGGEIANEVISITRAATVTSGSFTLTDGVDVTAGIAWNASASVVGTAVETLGTITRVSVYGDGSVDYPWVIEVTDPGSSNVTINLNGSTLDGDLYFSNLRDGGTVSPRPWHGSVDATAGVTIGSYEGFKMVEPGGIYPASTSDFILLLDGAAPTGVGDFPGAQIEAEVIGGHRYRASLRLNSPDSEQEIRVVVRDLSENLIAFLDYTINPAQGWVTIPIVDPANPAEPDGIFYIPDTVSTVLVRVGIVENDNPTALFIDVQDTANTFLSPGASANTYGAICNDLLAPITARGVLDWLTFTWSDVNDSSAVVWDRDLAVGVRRGQTFYQWFEYGRRWGYEWTFTFNGTSFSLNLYNRGNAGTDYTGLGGPSISSIDGMVDGGVKVLRAPDATHAIAEGDAGAWGESTDVALASGWGILEGYFANRQNRDGLSVLAGQMIAESAQQATGRRVRVQNPSNTPLDSIKLADTVPAVLPTSAGPTELKPMRVMGVTVGQSDDPLPFYDYHLDSMVFDPDAAQADAVRTLVRQYEALDNLGSGSGVDPLFTYQPPPPASVYTDSPGAPSALTGYRCATTTVNIPTTSHVWPIPTGRQAGDGMLVFVHSHGGSGNGAVTPPAGYTLLYSDSESSNYYVYVWWKISDGTEADTTLATVGNSIVAAASGRIPAAGATLSTPEISSPGAVVPASGPTTGMDPSSITPVAGAGDYHVIVAALMNKGAPDPDAATAVSAGYSYVGFCDQGDSVLRPTVYVEQKFVSVVTAEDPGEIGWVSSIGSRYFRAVTIAVRADEGTPALAPGDHNHEHGVLTGLADDDHPQYALTDGTRAFTGTVSGVTPTAAAHLTTKGYVDGLGGAVAHVLPFAKSGVLTVASGSMKFPAPFNMTLVGVRTAVGTAPTGASLIVDVNKNGTTVYTTQANRPTIAAGATSSSETVPDVTAVTAGDLLTVDIDQVGSTVAGSDIVVAIEYTGV